MSRNVHSRGYIARLFFLQKSWENLAFESRVYYIPLTAPKGMSITQPRKMTTDDYPTDDWIMNMFQHFHDPCPLFGKEIGKLDGLQSDWGFLNNYGVFINPPYSNVKPWVLKAIETKKEYPDLPIVMLLKHDSSTHWYRMLHEAGSHFLPIQGRLKHGTGQACAFPSVLVVL